MFKIKKKTKKNEKKTFSQHRTNLRQADVSSFDRGCNFVGGSASRVQLNRRNRNRRTTSSKSGKLELSANALIGIIRLQ